MKIADIEPVVVHVTQRGDWVFVLVHTDNGLTGLGEASHSSNDALLLATLDQFKQGIIGQSPLKIEAIWHRLARFKGGRIGQTALSAIEQALWDIMGQHLGVAIQTLFGGAINQRLRLYANINRHVTNRTPDGFALAATQAVEEGFTAIKLAPFDELNNPHHAQTGAKPLWQAGVARIRAVREAIGPEVELAVDCHSRLATSEAILVGEALTDCNLMWLEEPVGHAYVDDLARITQAVPMPTASAESLFGIEQFGPFLTQRTVDVIMPDVKHDGGLLETKQIGAAARMNQILVAPHNPSGPVASAATAQVASTMSNFYILEHAWGEVDWRADLLTPPERIEDGYLVVSEEPGLGHRLNMETVQAHLAATVRGGDSSKVVPV